MSDIVDQSAAAEEAFAREALAWRKQEVTAAGGVCLNCDTIIAPTHRWCDKDCRDDWEKRNTRSELPPGNRSITPEDIDAEIAMEQAQDDAE